MSQSNQIEGTCASVDEHLAEVLDGSAPPALFDHLAACDDCRDRRYLAERARDRLSGAGADFVAPAGFADDLVAAVLARRGQASGRVPAEKAPEPAPKATRLDEPAPEALAAPVDVLATAPTEFDPLPAGSQAGRRTEPGASSHATARSDQGLASRAPSSARPSEEPKEREPAEPTAPATRPAAPEAKPAAKVVPLKRRSRLGWVLGATLAASAAAAAGWLVHAKLSQEQVTAQEQAEGPWSGKVLQVSRASSDKTGGFQACDASGACVDLAAGAEIKEGVRLKTDARTRGFVKLADGSVLALDRDSELQLVAGEKRSAKLLRGSVVAEIADAADPKAGAAGAQAEAAPATFEITGAKALVAGAKIALYSAQDRSSVAVARGRVRLRKDGSTNELELRAGEEATIDGEILVGSASTLAESLELAEQSKDALEEGGLRGLGELKARKPGQTKEKERAVRLTKHHVRTRVVDVVARTEVEEVFTNDTDEELEGIFRFPLPPGAQIENLSLEVDGKLVEGAFVDRDKGAAIWRGVIQNAAPKAPKPKEEIVWVPGPWRDPALLEWQRGGRFELRIFPIPKKGSRRVILTYTQLVEQTNGVRRYVYPLAHDGGGTTKVDDFAFDFQVLGHDKAFGVKPRGYELASAAASADGERRTFAARGFSPAGDFTVEYGLPDRTKEITAWAYQGAPAPEPKKDDKAPAQPAALSPEAKAKAEALAAAKQLVDDPSPYVAIALRPKLPRWKQAKEHTHVLVVDSSRSMTGERFGRARRLASAVVREMDRRDQFVVLACDVTCRGMARDGSSGSPASAAALPPGSASAELVERFLGSIEPDGASDLAGAMLAAKAAVPGSGRDLRVIYLGDGTPTVGPTRSKHIEAAVRATVGAQSNTSVVAVALGTDADRDSLQALARGGGGVLVPFVPGQKVAAAAVDVLTAAYGEVLRDPVLELPPGLSEVSPRSLDPIRAGSETFVVARMKGGAEVSGTVKLRGKVAGESFEQTYPIKVLPSGSGGNAFVPRLYAAQKIADLEREGGDVAKLASIELSKRFGVASKHTSLLVLESEAMFKAFGLDRTRSGPVFTGEERASSTDGDAEGVADEVGAEKETKSAGKAKRADDFGANMDLSGVGEGGGGSAQAAPRAEIPLGDLGAVRKAPPAATMAQPPAASPPADKPVARDPARDIRGPGAGWRPPPPAPPGRRMIPMKRVFDRHVAFEPTNLAARDLPTRLISLENALSANPDSRDKTAELFGVYSLAGRIGQAQELAAKWAGRDALDPDAIVARAELLARDGDRERSIRVLSGLADVRPGDKAIQQRLADLHQTMGNAGLACRHLVTLAELAPTASVVARASSCASAQGLGELGSLLRQDAPEKLRAAIDQELAKSITANDRLIGDVQVTATWSGGVDLDLALIDAQGHRLSWSGAPSKQAVSARDVSSISSESLAVANLTNGSYSVEITRAAAVGAPGAPVAGELTLRLGNEVRKVPFVLNGNRVEVGSVRVFFTSRLVPMDGFGGGGGGRWREF